MARVRVYRNRTRSKTAGARWHIFGLLPTSLSLMGTGEWTVWPKNVEKLCVRENGWELVNEEDPSGTRGSSAG